MKLSLLDILHRKFRKGVLGYSIQDVEAFRQELVEYAGEAIDKVERLEQEKRALEEKLKDYHLKEETLNKSLILAEKTASERTEQAKREAALLIEEAKHQAQREVEPLHEERKRLVAEIEALKRQKEDFIASFETLLKNFLAKLERHD